MIGTKTKNRLDSSLHLVGYLLKLMQLLQRRWGCDPRITKMMVISVEKLWHDAFGAHCELVNGELPNILECQGYV